MASHPYISGSGNITQMISYLRKNFPATVSSETVKKYQLASNNESYVINALQFLGIIDEEGKRTEKGHDVLLLQAGEFEKAFATLVRDAYTDLFDLRGDDAWTLSKQELTAYFRTTDKTSDAIGARQAGVFLAFSALAGYEQQSAAAKPRINASNGGAKTTNVKAAKTKPQESVTEPVITPGSHTAAGKRDMALTVRIEINLPADGSQETYDNIFKSIKANLIDV
ncbi:DUF5343 domain-containing protein [Neorhizobium sp. AL 9.2.2]|uniref:DUF5343 domain-containing protein n=1 Tax=Neorhizobium sp. AL 9.2.2 TaxID=2712894 RepID=UPI001571CC07|nr:DUF5343 domain-containing protein [Neorhizobium sp. AL 9.2.2]NSY16166.1 DUF5343 domain-containing protein [Neorhizobium sp. AL 9.2.2]